MERAVQKQGQHRQTTQEDQTSHQQLGSVSTQQRDQVHQATQASGQGTFQPLGQEKRNVQTVQQEPKLHQHHHNARRVQLPQRPQEIKRQGIQGIDGDQNGRPRHHDQTGGPRQGRPPQPNLPGRPGHQRGLQREAM